MNIDKLSIDDLKELQVQIGETISKRTLDEAIGQSGEVVSKGAVDLGKLELIEDKLILSFTKWFAKNYAFQEQTLPKYIFKVNDYNDNFEVYLFSNTNNNYCVSAGRHSAIQIHKKAIEYFTSEFLAQFE